MDILQFLLIAGLFLSGLALLLRWKRPVLKGAIGEYRVHSHLCVSLEKEGCQILRDLTFPADGGTTQIDHVVVSESGVFVIETKNMAGWIFGQEQQARWTQVLYRKKLQFQNPLRQNYRHVKVVQDLLGLEADKLFNLVVFVGSATPRTAMPNSVLWGKRQLLRHIRSQHRQVLTREEVREIADNLCSRSLGSDGRTRRAHIRNVTARAAGRNNSCPRCNAPMVERTNRKTGRKFLSCSRFPRCKGSRSLS